MKKKIVYFILLISWLGLIFYFSNQPANESDMTSDGVIVQIINIVERVSNHTFNDYELELFYELAVFPVRKLAHFTLYFVLGILIFGLTRLYITDTKKLFIISSLMCILYACSDEVHQLFILGRSGNIKDVLIDASGSILGIFLYLKLVKRKNIKLNDRELAG